MKHVLVTNDFPPKIGGIQSLLWEWWRRLPPDRFAVLTSPYDGADEFDAGEPYRIERVREPVLLPHPLMVKRINELVADFGADLVVLDLMLPGVDGLTVLRRLRAAGDRVPVIVLSAKGQESERVAGLELGADDYISKPASPREVLARVRAVLRRSGTVGPETISVADLEIDVAGRRLKKLGNDLDLPPKEFDLLVRLASTPGEVHSRAELLRDVWGSSPDWQDPGTVTVHVRRLRKKLEVDPANPLHLVTVYGVGYRFDP